MQIIQNIIYPRPADYAAVKKFSIALTERYPCLSLSSAGRSVLGKELFCLELNAGEPFRKRTCNSARSAPLQPAVLYTAGFHAQEWLTGSVLLKFVQELCRALETGLPIDGIDPRHIGGNARLLFIPLVNPDGVDLAINGLEAAKKHRDTVQKISGGDLSDWNANIRGVDINHNFNAGWQILRAKERSLGITGPSPRRYGGPCPESEPETRALTALCRKRNIRHALALHAQGEEIYWRYGRHTPARARLMANVFAAVSEYTLCDPEDIASHGGFKDWFIARFCRPAFTIEMGKGKNPLPLSDLEPVYSRIREMLMLATLM